VPGRSANESRANCRCSPSTHAAPRGQAVGDQRREQVAPLGERGPVRGEPGRADRGEQLGGERLADDRGAQVERRLARGEGGPQRLGIGGQLLAEIINHAERARLTTIRAQLLADQAWITGMLRRYGPCAAVASRDVVDVTLRLGR
jgi:hypothetical protein